MENEIIEGLSKLKVEILDITNNPFKNLWDFYKIIWYKTDKQYVEGNDEQIKIINDILNMRTLPTPQETINITFRIYGLSRVGLARITRSRIGWSFNSFSSAPQRVKQKTIIPLNILKSKYGEEARELVKKAQELYEKLYDEDIPPQDIRYLSPQGAVGDLNCSVNFLALRSFFSRRICNSLEDEMNMICRLILKEIKLKIDNKEIHENWNYLLPKLDCHCQGIVCKTFDNVYGTCGRCTTGGISRKLADYRFENSWWASELKILPKDMLLSGEERIEEVKNRKDLQ